MINHFKTEADAIAHLTAKGFKFHSDCYTWTHSNGVHARVYIDQFRGVYVQFRDTVGA